MSQFRERFAWYRGRLAAMSAKELAHRFMEVAAKQAARRKSRGWRAIETTGTLASLPNVYDGVRVSDSEVATVVANAAKIVRDGYFNYLGARWPKSSAMPPSEGFWHIDPDDGVLFPQRDAYCFDISFRHAVDVREIKRIWELNRLQFIVPLSVDAAITKDPQSVALTIGIIRSWMTGNPPFRGPSWIFGIELALRVISTALALSIIGVDRFDPAARGMALQFFFAHVDWIRRFPSLYSSANNHRIAELAGLIVGATMAPGIPGAAELRENSWRALLVEIDRQIHPDGVGAEQSPGYTAFSVELFLLAATAYQGGRALPPATAARLSMWAEHSLWLMDVDGRVPAIGDFDDCRVVATAQGPESRYVASLVAAVSHRVGRPDLAPPAKDFNIRDLILGSSVVSSTIRKGLRSFPAGGYSVIRGERKPVVLTVDHGPVGYLSIAAHGHADALAVWLSVGKQPVIVDAGTYLYHSSRAQRNRFRHTAVHNTLTIDDIGSSRPSGPFNWATKANSRLVSSGEHPIPRIISEHDGYVSQFKLRHRRTVEFDRTSRFTIIDELLGTFSHISVTVSFLLHPACTTFVDPNKLEVLVMINNCAIARLVGLGALKPRIVRGDELSGLGWVSPSFGVRVPTDQILFEGNINNSSMITIDLF